MAIDPGQDYAGQSQEIDIGDGYGVEKRTHTAHSLYVLDAEGEPESETHFYDVLRQK